MYGTIENNARWKQYGESDLSEDTVIGCVCTQEAFCVTAGVSVGSWGTAGSAAGSAG